jgi:hypothetical protein
MSLNWNLSKIVDHDTLCWLPAAEGQKDEDRNMSPITNAIIWACMGNDIGTITEANYLEFYARCMMMSKLFGTPLCKFEDGKRIGIDITVEDVKAHIGLSTNVSTKSRAAFIKRHVEHFLSDEVGRQKQAAKEAVAA